MDSVVVPVCRAFTAQSDSIKAFSKCFVAAQLEMQSAARDSTNPHFKSRYADLASVSDACRPALNKHGISILQPTVHTDKPNYTAIDTILLHESGEWVSARTEMPLPKNDPQGFGLALTYARRYALAAMTGVCPEDDDGNEASIPQQNRAPQQQQQQQRTQPKQESKPAPKPEATKPVVLASAEQIEKVNKLLSLAALPVTKILTWFEKAGVKDWKEMPADKIEKCIKSVEDLISKRLEQEQPAKAA